jgi:hypothetical protein
MIRARSWKIAACQDANAAQSLDLHRWSVARYTDAARPEQCDHIPSHFTLGRIAADCVGIVWLPLAFF